MRHSLILHWFCYHLASFASRNELEEWLNMTPERIIAEQIRWQPCVCSESPASMYGITGEAVVIDIIEEFMNDENWPALHAYQ